MMVIDRNTKENQRFSLVARLRSANHAWRGLGIVFKTTHNLWLQMVFAVLAVSFGFMLKISITEWLFLVFAIGVVIITETLNTAFEVDIDLTSPEFHPYARDTKDIAAGAVLLSVLLAIIVGGVIFFPKVLPLFNNLFS